jgi:inorganic pyrophosphatase
MPNTIETLATCDSGVTLNCGERRRTPTPALPLSTGRGGQRIASPQRGVTPCDSDHEEWRVVIETPKSSHNKYKYDPELDCFELARVLPQGMVFPFDFGFLPSTVAADGDPLDVLLLMDQSAFPGCIVRARLVGVIEAEQTERNGTSERNDRLIAVPIQARDFEEVRSAKDMDKNVLKEIERFFINYNKEEGKKFKLLGLHGPHRAKLLAKEGMKQFDKQRRGRRSARKNTSRR